jgi:hypothetical protein
MFQKQALERWETKLANFQSHISNNMAKSLTERGRPKAPSAIDGPLDPIFYPYDKANINADCLENQFRAHYLCDCDHR